MYFNYNSLPPSLSSLSPPLSPFSLTSLSLSPPSPSLSSLPPSLPSLPLYIIQGGMGRILWRRDDRNFRCGAIASPDILCSVDLKSLHISSSVTMREG